MQITLLMIVTTTVCANYPANDTYRCTKCLCLFIEPGRKSFEAERSGVRVGWESIISLATAWLDPFSEGLSPASHQLLLRPAAPPHWAWMWDGVFPWSGSRWEETRRRDAPWSNA